MSTFGWSRRGTGVLLTALICAVLAGSGFDSTVSAQSVIDYDADNDGLIEVRTEARLGAIRWDLNGNGAVDDSANLTTYSAAFPNAAQQMGCPGTACTGYELAANISLTSNSGVGWEPIGDSTTSFTATFEGNGRTISNLFINRTTDHGGLFGATGTASAIRNVKLTSVNVTGNDYVGALAGDNSGQIDNCEAAGTVTGNSHVGGLVGQNAGPITGSSAGVAVTATVTGGNANTGGLVGQNLTGPIRNSHASGNVTGSGNGVGGLVGSNYDVMAANGADVPRNAISGSTARGTVTSTAHIVGGLVGRNNGSISDSAALNPNVTGAVGVGGLVGTNNDNQADGSNAISGSTASGTVTATGNLVGGLVGWNNGPISDSAALNPSVTGVGWVGGLVGVNTDAQVDGSNTISGSTARGTVTGGENVGGLVGWSDGPISDSAALNPSVTGTIDVGGLVGQTEGGMIDRSIATANVAGTVRSGGGLVGFNTVPSRDSYASGAVQGANSPNFSRYIGGLVGNNAGGQVINSRADGDVSVPAGQGDSIGGLAGC